ncbi:MAG: hypothetical protein WCW30_04905, partial [Candidatus Gracilibacteria bacterium]
MAPTEASPTTAEGTADAPLQASPQPTNPETPTSLDPAKIEELGSALAVLPDALRPNLANATQTLPENLEG